MIYNIWNLERMKHVQTHQDVAADVGALYRRCIVPSRIWCADYFRYSLHPKSF